MAITPVVDAENQALELLTLTDSARGAVDGARRLKSQAAEAWGRA